MTLETGEAKRKQSNVAYLHKREHNNDAIMGASSETPEPAQKFVGRKSLQSGLQSGGSAKNRIHYISSSQVHWLGWRDNSFQQVSEETRITGPTIKRTLSKAKT